MHASEIIKDMHASEITKGMHASKIIKDVTDKGNMNDSIN